MNWTREVRDALELCVEKGINLSQDGGVSCHEPDHYEDLLAEFRPDEVELRPSLHGMMWFYRDDKHILTFWPDDKEVARSLLARFPIHEED